jgi:hypothetical protein
MERRQERHAAEVEPLAAGLRDRRRASVQRFEGVRAEGDDGARGDDIDLRAEVRKIERDLARGRRALAILSRGLRAPHHDGHEITVGRVDRRGGEDFLEQLTGLAGESLAGFHLHDGGRFADEHDLGVERAVAEERPLRGDQMLLRLSARLDELTQSLEALGLRTGGEGEDRRIGNRRGGHDDGRLGRGGHRSHRPGGRRSRGHGWTDGSRGSRRLGGHRGRRGGRRAGEGLQGGQGVGRDADAADPGGLLALELLKKDIQSLCGIVDHGRERDWRARARVKSFSVI